jgi:hypothetical protein
LIPKGSHPDVTDCLRCPVVIGEIVQLILAYAMHDASTQDMLAFLIIIAVITYVQIPSQKQHMTAHASCVMQAV